MLQDTKFTGYGGADGSAPRASRRGRTIETGGFSRPQAAPRLFLLGEDPAEPPPAFAPARAGGILPARLSKAFICVVVAAILTVAILVALSLSFQLFAASSPVDAAESRVSLAVPAVENEATLVVAATSQNVVATPTRSEISAAFNTAYQNRIELPQAARAVPAARKMDRDELAGLMKRARALIAAGDIAPARLLLLRAADAREPSAALLLAQTYDPAVLGQPDVRSLAPDPEAARQWYRKATEFGSDESKQLAEIKN